MQIELGAPMTAARASPVGVLPLTARVPGVAGTSIVNIRKNCLSVSNTWMRRFDAIAHINVVVAVDPNRMRQPELSWRLPLSPHDFTQSPFFVYLATRELM